MFVIQRRTGPPNYWFTGNVWTRNLRVARTFESDAAALACAIDEIDPHLTSPLDYEAVPRVGIWTRSSGLKGDKAPMFPNERHQEIVQRLDALEADVYRLYRQAMRLRLDLQREWHVLPSGGRWSAAGQEASEGKG